MDFKDEPQMNAFRGPMRLSETGESVPCILMCWECNKEDIDEVNRTGKIWVAVAGITLPPVFVFTENPFP